MAPPHLPAAFFDRDGVINVDHGYVHSVDRFELIAGAAQALRLCRDAGFLIFIVTNQAGVARGYYDEAAISRLHDHLRDCLLREGASVDDIRYCPHLPDATVVRYACECSWRKPAPGMILDIARHWPVDLRLSFLVGDKDSDIAAAQAAGVTGHLFTGNNLADFVKPIIAETILKAGPVRTGGIREG